MPSLYHAWPAEMRGEVLYPLSRLAAVDRDLYDAARAKYVGREALLELRIPILDVLWNDALQLAPVHPAYLAAAWRAAGLSSPLWERDFVEIPVERVDAERSVWFASGVLSKGESLRQGVPLSLPVDEVAPFDPVAYRELTAPPTEYSEYLRRCETEGRRARPFAYLPHVLVAAPIDVTGLSLVRADAVPS